jgi:hypothetical protein
VRVRRSAFLTAALVVCVLLVGGSALASNGESVACAAHCGGSSATVHGHSPSAPSSCVRDAGCGGGAALALGAGGALAVLFGTRSLVGRAVGMGRKLAVPRLPLSVLLASGLFRPPRVVLDV